jgi:hypothetical protein
MNRIVFHILCLGAFALSAGCGPEQPTSDGSSPPIDGPSPLALQHLSFTGVADPVRGSLQLIPAPRAFFGTLTEDANGSTTTVTANTVQVYSSSTAFTNTNPAGCASGSANHLTASVEVFSGFTEQLRNVYARIGAVSGGQSACATTTPSPSFTGSGSLTPNLGLYRYRPLNPGTSANFAIKRTVSWAMNLPDNGAFWFTGDLWAQVIPQPPTITAPTSGQVFTTAASSLTVNFAWTNDPLADGTNPESDPVARPNLRRSQLIIYRCGLLNAVSYDPNNCSVFYGPTNQRNNPAGVSLTTGYWYRAQFNARFQILPLTTTYVGGLNSTRIFQVKH